MASIYKYYLYTTLNNIANDFNDDYNDDTNDSVGY